MLSRVIRIVTGAALTGCLAAAAQLPMIGASYGQTVRLVITAGDPIPTEGVARCSAVARIVTRELLPAAAKSFDLGPGESGFVDVNINPLAERLRRRVELLPAVQVLAGSCSASIEVFENFTGQTMAHLQFGLLLPAVRLTSAMEGLAPVGGTTNQILRLGAIRGFDPQPDPPGCNVLLGFADARGNAVGPVKAINLSPGASDFVDLDFGLLLPASGAPLRTQRFVRPRLLLPAAGGGAMGGCAVSVQVFDKLTGWTNIAYTAK